jgi:DNA-binding cell septation regulator SpoVG
MEDESYSSKFPIEITNIDIVPIRSREGLLGFASCYFCRNLFLGNIAVRKNRQGDYWILFPVKQVGNRNFEIFHPVNRAATTALEEAIIAKAKEIFEPNENQVSQLDED